MTKARVAPLSVSPARVDDDLTAAVLLAADADARLRDGDTLAARDELGVLRLVIANLVGRLRGEGDSAVSLERVVHQILERVGGLVRERSTSLKGTRIRVPERVLVQAASLLAERVVLAGGGHAHLHIDGTDTHGIRLRIVPGSVATASGRSVANGLLESLSDVLHPYGVHVQSDLSGVVTLGVPRIPDVD